MKTAPPQDEIDRFLATGDHDLLFLNWPGANILDRAQRGSRTLADALAAEVRRRAASVTVRMPDALRGTDIVTFTRRKVEPMVRGLFPAKEQGPVLALLERSLVFLTPETIEPLIRNENFLSTAWLAANVYLESIGAEPLNEVESIPVGFSEETTCYVSMAYFNDKDPFAAYVVHETAHVFHNTKRKTLGGGRRGRSLGWVTFGEQGWVTSAERHWGARTKAANRLRKLEIRCSEGGPQEQPTLLLRPIGQQSSEDSPGSWLFGENPFDLLEISG